MRGRRQETGDRRQETGDRRQETGDGEPLSASAAFDGGSSCIGAARHLVTGFLIDVRAVHGVRVSERALGMTRLVVGELVVTNAVKYAPGPVMLDMRIDGGAVRVSVWDSDPVLPDVASTDPQRVGRHGLGITLAVIGR
ncbi:ATP-binding protein [Streptomyces sp. B21-083]|uniref:ATP-binding protein n=1 Tax=Streptomyces sp. B21-083 TaxID=3039410 RepID=UPI002FEFB920